RPAAAQRERVGGNGVRPSIEGRQRLRARRREAPAVLGRRERRLPQVATGDRHPLQVPRQTRREPRPPARDRLRPPRRRGYHGRGREGNRGDLPIREGGEGERNLPPDLALLWQLRDAQELGPRR